MSEANSRTEGKKEPGQVAYEARFSHKPHREVDRWASLEPEAREIWKRVEKESVASAEAEVGRLTALVADYEEAADDRRRLAREIDVAMHGEEGAARQPSLCDLVGPARDLKDRVSVLEEALRPFASIAPSTFYAADGSENERYAVTLSRPIDCADFLGSHLAAARIALVGSARKLRGA